MLYRLFADPQKELKFAVLVQFLTSISEGIQHYARPEPPKAKNRASGRPGSGRKQGQNNSSNSSSSGSSGSSVASSTDEECLNKSGTKVLYLLM